MSTEQETKRDNSEILQSLLTGEDRKLRGATQDTGMLPLYCGHERKESEMPWARCDQCSVKEISMPASTMVKILSADCYTYFAQPKIRKLRSYSNTEKSASYNTYRAMTEGRDRETWYNMDEASRRALMVATWIDIRQVLETPEKIFQDNFFIDNWLIEKIAYGTVANYMKGRDVKP